MPTQEEGREPQRARSLSPARPPRHSPRPGPRRAFTPAGRARSGSRAGVRTRAAPAAPGPRRCSEASVCLQVWSHVPRNCSCLESALNYFPISRQVRRRRPALARERGGGAYGRGEAYKRRGAEPALQSPGRSLAEGRNPSRGAGEQGSKGAGGVVCWRAKTERANLAGQMLQ